MSNKIDVDLFYDRENDPDNIKCRITLLEKDYLNLDAQLSIVAEVNVKDSRPVNEDKTLFQKNIKLNSSLIEFTIPRNSLTVYNYFGHKINIDIHTIVKVDNRIIFDTKIKERQEISLGLVPTAGGSASELINPKDLFDFKKNLAAIPSNNRLNVMALLVVGGVLILTNALIGCHDQISPESQTFIYSHTNSEGESQSPLVAALVGCGVLGAIVWAIIKSQLKKYMTFNFKGSSSKFEPNKHYPIAEIVTGRSRVHIDNAQFKIVACNMEKGQYKRGYGTDERTISFSEPVRGLLLFNKSIPRIEANTPIEHYLPESVSFEKVFNSLYPPLVVGSAHGLELYWEVQLLCDDFIDQELIGAGSDFAIDWFDRKTEKKEKEPEPENTDDQPWLI